MVEGFEDFVAVGSGANAHVYRARDTSTGEIVAVKILRGAGNPDVNRRFERERELMDRVSSHPSIVTILGSGVTPAGDPYLVMPLYSGGSLATRLATGPVPWAEALQLIAPVADALTYAHSQGVLHLDVKPANVLVDEQGRPLLADFGIAELAGSTASMSGSMLTPAYTPLERLRSEKPTEKADIYGVAATLFALLTGEPPFGGGTTKTNPAAVVMSIVNDPLPVEDLPKDLPPEIHTAIRSALAKEPDDRLPTMAGFSSAIQPYGPPNRPKQDTYTTADSTSTIEGSQLLQSGTAPVVPIAANEAANKRRKAVLVGATLGFVALLGAAIASALALTNSPKTVTAATNTTTSTTALIADTVATTQSASSTIGSESSPTERPTSTTAPAAVLEDNPQLSTTTTTRAPTTTTTTAAPEICEFIEVRDMGNSYQEQNGSRFLRTYSTFHTDCDGQDFEFWISDGIASEARDGSAQTSEFGRPVAATTFCSDVGDSVVVGITMSIRRNGEILDSYQLPKSHPISGNSPFCRFETTCFPSEGGGELCSYPD